MDSQSTARPAPGTRPQSLIGLGGAVVGFLLSLTPSLLPRPSLLMGLLAGLVAAIGYGSAVVVARVIHRLGVPGLPAGARPLAQKVVLGVGGTACAIGTWLALGWQNDIRTAIGVATEPPVAVAVIGAVALVSFIGFRQVGRAIGAATRRTSAALGSRLPSRVAKPLAVAIAVIVCCSFVVAVGLAVLRVTDNIYAEKNRTSPDWAQAPSSTLSSGGPGSAVSWDSIGYEGQAFIASGPTAASLHAVTGRPTEQPIRVFVGLESADTPEMRAALAVAELQRTGAFQREVLVVAGVAGTGWLEAQSLDSLEYLWDGNTAIVASQYSYLPSWISVLVDQEKAQAEGRALFDAVHQAWAQLPAGQRPRLIGYGLSLGSYSIQSAFDSAQDMASQLDGAILAGTPSMSQPWGDITAGRDAGSPQWQPIVDGGQTIRFADNGQTFSALGPWSTPRIGYLQHADDPVVWWSFHLIASAPDWLREPPGPAVSPQMRWLPGITFLQVAIDQMLGVNQPNGYGHNYSAHMVLAWQAVVGSPPGWTPEETARVEAALFDSTG